jgi:hypothetical protein
MQQVGRVARPSEGKEYGLILDAAGNCERLGFPEQISAALTADNVLSYGVESLGQAPSKKCPRCDEILLASARECPNCGYEFPIAIAEKEHAVGEFVDLINPENVRHGTLTQHINYYRYLIAREWNKGRCPSAAFGLYLKQGFDQYPKPDTRWGRGAIFGDNPKPYQIKQYWDAVQRWKTLRNKDSQWAAWLINQEFGRLALDQLQAAGVRQSA